MNSFSYGTVTERLDRNRYDTDTEHAHIVVDQDAAQRAGARELLVRVCPAHVYSLQEDGNVGVLYAACLECGTCLAVAPVGVLAWEYPASGKGIIYREG
jgi:ferredoxin like protein